MSQGAAAVGTGGLHGGRAPGTGEPGGGGRDTGGRAATV